MPFDTAAMTREAVAVRTRSWTVFVAAMIVAVQGLVIFALGAYLEWSAFSGTPDSRVSAVLMGILCLVGGAGLLLCGSGLWRLRRWSRSPALVWQLLMIPVGSYQVQGSLRPSGIAVIVASVIAAVLLIVPRTTKSLAD